MPPNARLGERLRKDVQDRLAEEEVERRRKGRESSTEPSDGELVSAASKRKKSSAPVPYPSPGGHVRIGWSMRTGDLQAPVGYDRWSYGLRDIGGSRVHDSRREDRWGGEDFLPGDIMGFAVCLVGEKSKGDNKKDGGGKGGGKDDKEGDNDGGAKSRRPTNHIRFFKNGEALGDFVVTRGVRQGGEAFDRITPGTYYPAVSAYMGGSAQLNFGPHFVYPPRTLPSGMKVRPVSDLCPPPPDSEEAVELALRARAFPKKTDEASVASFRDAVRAEATIRYDCYLNHMKRHIREVSEARKDRGLSTGDLPCPLLSPRGGDDGDDMSEEED